ncbi:hypothetical protein F0562_017588 [Nyssa sinensis]|uniref:Uncharacterized protein n=1 Tax=Nyssa sinensis TaxID=561372 RepID=A0A5J4ZFG9_9ASTE|nr:hypothetical protein F0562_017588 [Nyssa sinensis]
MAIENYQLPQVLKGRHSIFKLHQFRFVSAISPVNMNTVDLLTMDGEVPAYPIEDEWKRDPFMGSRAKDNFWAKVQA